MKEYYDNDLLSEIRYNITNKKFDVAKIKIDEYIKKYPNDGMIKVLLMQYYNNTNQQQEACNLGYEQIGVKFREDKIFAGMYREFAVALEALDRIDEAISYLEYAVSQTNGKISFIIAELAKMYSKNQEPDKAIKILNDNMNYRNENDYYLVMAKVYLTNNDYQLSIDVASKANDSKLKANQIQKKYYTIAQSYFSLGELESALQNFKKVLTIKTERYYISYYTMARIYALQGKFQDAANICEELLKLKRGGTDVKSLLNDVYQAMDKPNGSLNISKYISPTEEDYRNGKYCIEQFDYLSALNHFNKYLEKKGKFHENEVLFLIILCKFKLGKYRECLDEIYTFNPSDEQVNDITRMKFYCKCVLNELGQEQTYTTIQVANYSEENALNHVNQRHILSDFNKYISFKRLFEIVRTDLTKDKLDPYAPFDRYELDLEKYENYIEKLNLNCNKLTVICLPNTKNILTMFTNVQKEDDLDISEANLNVKKKTLSRTEKFNQKYAKFVS